LMRLFRFVVTVTFIFVCYCSMGAIVTSKFYK
jgi:hypothetical protein